MKCGSVRAWVPYLLRLVVRQVLVIKNEESLFPVLDPVALLGQKPLHVHARDLVVLETVETKQSKKKKEIRR